MRLQWQADRHSQVQDNNGVRAQGFCASARWSGEIAQPFARLA
jgi:hypothetical protein